MTPDDGQRRAPGRPEPEEPGEDDISDEDIIAELDNEPDASAAEAAEEDLGLADDADVESLDEEPGAGEREDPTGRHPMPQETAPGSGPRAELDPLEGPTRETCPDTQEFEGPGEPPAAGRRPEGDPGWEDETPHSADGLLRSMMPEDQADTEDTPVPPVGPTDPFAAPLPRRRATMPLAGPPLSDRPALAKEGEPEEEEQAEEEEPEDLSEEPAPEIAGEPAQAAEDAALDGDVPARPVPPDPGVPAEDELPPEFEAEPEPEEAAGAGQASAPVPADEPSADVGPSTAGAGPDTPDADAEERPSRRSSRGRRRRVSEPPPDEKAADGEGADSEFNAEPKPIETTSPAPRHRAAGGRSWADEAAAESAAEPPADEVSAFAQAAGAGSDPTRVEPFAHDAPQVSEKTLILGHEEALPEPAYLIIVSGDEEGREVELERPEMTIGRGPDNDLVLPDIACSRRHAKVERQGDEFFIEDLGSGNGTLLNGRKVKRNPLADGDRIEVGNTVLEFHRPEAATEEEGRATDEEEVEDAGGREAGDPEPTRAHGRTTITGPVLPEGDHPRGPLARLLADPKRKKLVVFGGGALGGLFLIAMVMRLFMPTPPREPTPEELERKARIEARRQFDQHMDDAKVAVQAKKWREALAAVQAAEEFDPENPMVISYKTTIQVEMSSASALSMARLHMEAKEWDKAMGALQGISPDSDLKEQAAAMKKELEGHLLDDLLAQGQQMMQARQYNQAILKFDEVLQRSPGNEEALVAKRLAEEALEKEQKGSRNTGGGGKRKRVTKVRNQERGGGLTGQALALYKNGEVERAIDKAENGGASGEELSRLRAFKTVYDKAMDAAKNAGQPGQAVEALLKAYNLDKQISGGQGEYRRILSEKLAKAYMVKGVDAHTGRRLPEAYKSYRSALQYDPGLPKVKERLEELKREAKKLYEEAYVIKSNNQEMAISKLKTVLQIIPPDEIYYGKAKKLLSSLLGEGDSNPEGSGEGF